jgi:hypothetical protein
MISKKLLALFIIALFSFVFSGCTTTPAPQPTKGSLFPKMYEEQPRSLLILPPMNESTDAEAKDYYMTTVEMPYALMGYYTFPVEMVGDIMKQEGIYDTELLYEMPLDKFAEYFGADAILFTRIKKWDVAYMVVASNLTVSIESKIVSTKTSEVLWAYNGHIVVDLSGGNNSGDLAALIVNAVATTINTASADYVKYARQVNARMMYALPAGPYHPLYLQDQETKLLR